MRRGFARRGRFWVGATSGQPGVAGAREMCGLGKRRGWPSSDAAGRIQAVEPLPRFAAAVQAVAGVVPDALNKSWGRPLPPAA